MSVLGKLTKALLMKWVRSDYRTVFGSAEGKRVLSDLLRYGCGTDQDPHAPGDPYATHHNIGRQYVATYIRRCMNLTDDEIARLTQENAYADEGTQQTHATS